VIRSAILALLVAFWLVGGTGCATGGPRIELSLATEGPRVLLVKGLDAAALQAFEALQEPQRQEVLWVRVAGRSEADVPSVLGSVTERGEALAFVPRYPFTAGLKYQARFDGARLGRGAMVERTFSIAPPPPPPAVRVEAIYPSGDELPENLLKFYIHFSGPMSRGEAYKHVRLLNEKGEVVPYPFLELAEELWNPEMTRFTLFFEPGRIKQGLVPRMEAGPALESGKTYTLVVDSGWSDGEGRPLAAGMRKVFRAGPVDAVQPNPSRWRVTPPANGTKGALVVDFEEALDHAMLQRVLTVRLGEKVIAGRVGVKEHEKRWTFTPELPWEAGRYVIRVQTILEDRSGNSIGRAFEVENTGAPGGAAGPEEVDVGFEVK